MRDGASPVTLHLPAVAKMSCLGGTSEALASDITTGSPGSPGSEYCQLSTILKTSATLKARVALGAVSDRNLAWATMPLTGDTSYNGSHEVLAGSSSARVRFKRAVEERRIWHPREHRTHSQG